MSAGYLQAVRGEWNNVEGGFKLEVWQNGKKLFLGYAIPGHQLVLTVEDDVFVCRLYRKSGMLGYRHRNVQQYPLHVELHTESTSDSLIAQNVLVSGRSRRKGTHVYSYALPAHCAC